MPLQLTQAQLQAIIDGAFTFLESKTGRPIVKGIEQAADATINLLMPQLYAELQKIGVIATS